jgi:putative heme-binding domain-containing protein
MLFEPLINLSLSLGERDSLALLLKGAFASSEQNGGTEQMLRIAAFLDALARKKSSLEKLDADHDDALAKLLNHAPEAFARARTIVPDPTQATPRRVAAVNLLGREERKSTEDLQLLSSLLGSKNPREVQQSAVKAIGRLGGARVPDLFFQAWPSLGPDLLLAVIDECLARESWTLAWLERVERGQLAMLNLDAARRERLLKHRSEQVKTLARKILTDGAANPNRQKVIEEYRPALSLSGNSVTGAAVFARVCSACHQLEGVGREIGPNLVSVANHAPERLFISILDPSREVQSAYLAYNCELADGTEVYGIIVSETGASVTLKLTDGTERTVLRNEIQSLQSARVSLMPEGLETGMSKQELADLIAYLRKSAAGK